MITRHAQFYAANGKGGGYGGDGWGNGSGGGSGGWGEGAGGGGAYYGNSDGVSKSCPHWEWALAVAEEDEA